MLSFPNAKINLGLQIKSKRDDGYHEIETCLYPIPLNDTLEVIPQKENKLLVTGIKIDGRPEENLCFKAIKLLSQIYQLPNLYVHLHKIIPHGAGLGGGSSDAVSTLLSINKILDLKIEEKELLNLSAYLGSDCPFFVRNSPAIAKGRGEILQPINLSLKDNYLVLVFPKLYISSSVAYSLITAKTPKDTLENILSQDISNWKNLLTNDFQNTLEMKYPQLKELSDKMYKKNAFYSAMSGSGSSYFGLFEEDPGEVKSWFKNNYYIFKAKLA